MLPHFLWFYCNLDNAIQFLLEDVVSLPDILQLIAVGNQQGSVDFACFDMAHILFICSHYRASWKQMQKVPKLVRDAHLSNLGLCFACMPYCFPGDGIQLAPGLPFG